MDPASLFRLEHLDVLRLLIWGAASVFAGTTMLLTLAAARAGSPLLSGFGGATLGWGFTELAIAAWRWRTLGPRDLAAALALSRTTWFVAGLDVGIIAVGATLAIAAWRFGRRLAPTGAGMATIVQGTALFAMHTRLVLGLLTLG